MSANDPSAAESTAIHRRVAALQRGLDPSCIARLASGWAVFGERQFLRGYALLLPDPVVPTLNDLQPLARAQFLADMARLGDALLLVTGALRINYAMFGNLEPALHAHLVPRYRDERAPLDVAHPWAYDWASAPIFDAERELDLLTAVRAALAA
ncbi:MAG: hypothetical protein FJ160_08700 [Gammaproteobacteria bacterium]|nr:hypothetical protein [Gammaproteobacteria bacterium]